MKWSMLAFFTTYQCCQLQNKLTSTAVTAIQPKVFVHETPCIYHFQLVPIWLGGLMPHILPIEVQSHTPHQCILTHKCEQGVLQVHVLNSHSNLGWYHPPLNIHWHYQPHEGGLWLTYRVRSIYQMILLKSYLVFRVSYLNHLSQYLMDNGLLIS